MNLREGLEEANKFGNKVMENIQMGEVSTGMVDYSDPNSHLSDDEWEKVLSMMNNTAKAKGFSSVNEQVQKVNARVDKGMGIISNPDLMAFMNEERMKDEIKADNAEVDPIKKESSEQEFD